MALLESFVDFAQRERGGDETSPNQSHFGHTLGTGNAGASAYGTVLRLSAFSETAKLFMTQRFAEGMNYSIDLEGSMAICRVWSRRDLDSAKGAQLATEKIGLFRVLAKGEVAKSMLLDLSNAPVVTGPKTQTALGEMLKAWQEASKPVAVVASSHSIQQLQLRRLIQAFAPTHGALFGAVEEAAAWIESCVANR